MIQIIHLGNRMFGVIMQNVCICICFQDLSVSFSSDKGHQVDHHFGFMGGKESDRSLMTVESSIDGREESVAEASNIYLCLSAQTCPLVANDLWKVTSFMCFMQAFDVWSQPSSTNFRQCIVSNSHKSKLVTVAAIF